MPSGWRGMLVVETIGRIRREHLVKGKPIKEIVRELKVSRNTVRKVLRSGATSGLSGISCGGWA
jgi:DNA invertase Pin-like site-specific DNA recombinase